MAKDKKILHGVVELAGQLQNSVLGLKAMGLKAEPLLFTGHAFASKQEQHLGIDRKNYLAYPCYLWRIFLAFLRNVFRHDVYHFHYKQSMLPWNMDLPILRILRKRIIFEYHGSDLRQGASAALLPKALRSYYEGKKGERERRLARQSRYADSLVLHDHELLPYLPAAHPPVSIVPLRVNLGPLLSMEASSAGIPADGIHLVHAPSQRRGKGTAAVLAAVESLQKRYPLHLTLVENMPNDEARARYKAADILIDQLCTGAYGVFAVEGMALGKPVITYITEEMRAKYPASLPLVSADEASVEAVLEALILSPETWKKIGEEGVAYAKRYHDHLQNAKFLAAVYAGERVDGFERLQSDAGK